MKQNTTNTSEFGAFTEKIQRHTTWITISFISGVVALAVIYAIAG